MSANPVLTPGRFYGAVDRQWRSDLVTISVIRHRVPRAVPQHGHVQAFIMLLLGGRYHERIDDRCYDYRPLSVVFHPEGLVHQDEIGADGATLLSVEVAPALLDGEIGDSAGVRSVHDLSGGPPVWMMLGLLRDMACASHSPLPLEEPVAALVDTLAGCRRALPACEPAWLARIDRLLRARYREPLSMLELAREARVHPVHLARVFRKARGQSIRTVVHRLRVLEACRLLQDGHRSLAEVALQTGFCDQSHLSTVCRRITGFSPRRLRQLVATR